MEKINVTLIVLTVLLVFSIIGLVVSIFVSPSLRLQPVPTESRVTISEFFSIDVSPELLSGIIFETVDETPLAFDNATENYAGAGSGTLYNISVLSDSNTDVAVCIRADRPLTDDVQGGLVLGALSDELYLSNLTTDANTPGPQESGNPFRTFEAFPDIIVPIDGAAHYRFWLNVGGGAPIGSFNNTVTFVMQSDDVGICPP